jgi:hypothetical protein
VVFAVTVPAIKPFEYSDTEEGKVLDAAKEYVAAKFALN